MRTTINLPDGLATQAKQRAAERGCPANFTALVVEGLYRMLDETPPTHQPSLSTWGDGTGRMLIDLQANDALW